MSALCTPSALDCARGVLTQPEMADHVEYKEVSERLRNLYRSAVERVNHSNGGNAFEMGRNLFMFNAIHIFSGVCRDARLLRALLQMMDTTDWPNLSADEWNSLAQQASRGSMMNTGMACFFVTMLEERGPVPVRVGNSVLSFVPDPCRSHRRLASGNAFAADVRVVPEDKTHGRANRNAPYFGLGMLNLADARFELMTRTADSAGAPVYVKVPFGTVMRAAHSSIAALTGERLMDLNGRHHKLIRDSIDNMHATAPIQHVREFLSGLEQAPENEDESKSDDDATDE